MHPISSSGLVTHSVCQFHGWERVAIGGPTHSQIGAIFFRQVYKVHVPLHSITDVALSIYCFLYCGIYFCDSPPTNLVEGLVVAGDRSPN